jgi:hypothetical protein
MDTRHLCDLRQKRFRMLKFLLIDVVIQQLLRDRAPVQLRAEAVVLPRLSDVKHSFPSH